MAVQRQAFPFLMIMIIITMILFSSLIISASNININDQDPPHDHDHHLEEYGYDFEAYPSSYITSVEDNYHESGRVLDSSETVSVHDFGAKGDGRTDDTQAFEKAWSKACSSRGAVFLIPQKTYLVKPITFSGPCHSDLTMQIYGTIEASDDRADYNKDGTHWIVFDSVQNLVVEGGGTISGNGMIWWQNSCKIDEALPCKNAPTALTFYNCKNVKVNNLKIQNAQQIHVSFEKCVNVQATKLVVTSPEKSPNTDGIHVANTQNIQISNCVIGTGDDCISIVSGSQKVQATDITCGPGHGISIGSLGSGNSEAYVSDVVVNGAKLSGTSNGVRIKTWPGGSGSATNIKFQNVEMYDVSNPIIIDQNYCDQKTPCEDQRSTVQVKNVVYQNIKGTSASDVALNFDCSKSFPCQGIVLQDVEIEREGGDAAAGAAKALCKNVKVIEVGVVSPHCP